MIEDKMKVDAKEESNCWDSVSIAMSIIGIINAAVMAAAAAVCKDADDGNSSTMTVLSLHSMFTPIFIYHIVAAVLTLISCVASIFLVAFSFCQRYKWGGQVGFWLAVLVFLVDLGVPSAVLLGEQSWNGVNSFPSLNIFEMYSRSGSKQLADLKILYGVEIVLGFTIFLLGNIASVFYWMMKMSYRKEEGLDKTVNDSELELGINHTASQQKVEAQAFD